jgi:hypothetical protein
MKDMLANAILNYLECPPHAPSLRYLNRLINSCIRKVPWESVSRIVKRHTTLNTRECPRLPEEFWWNAIQYGFGGTCFESSLAFYTLLMQLGYDGYLVVNDMGMSHACHAAIVILQNGEKYLVDITIPVDAAIHFDPQRVTRRRTAFQDYTIRPVRENAYEVERSPHPSRNAFTLIDIPVGLPEYYTIVENDYTDTGYFLKSVVMVKVIENKTYRFFSDHKPYRLESFSRAGKDETFLPSGRVAQSLARIFQMPQGKIADALSSIEEIQSTGDMGNELQPLPLEPNAE